MGELGSSATLRHRGTRCSSVGLCQFSSLCHSLENLAIVRQKWDLLFAENVQIRQGYIYISYIQVKLGKLVQKLGVCFEVFYYRSAYTATARNIYELCINTYKHLFHKE